MGNNNAPLSVKLAETDAIALTMASVLLEINKSRNAFLLFAVFDISFHQI